jgi:hypothetical protein
MGSILVDNDEANRSIAQTNEAAERTGSTFGEIGRAHV